MSELQYPETLKYTVEHIWVRQDEDGYSVGITSFAQKQLGEVVFVEMPEADDAFEAGEVFGSIESFKAVSELYMPCSGTIVAVNEALEDDPSQVNASPYGDGWILKVSLADAGALDGLMDHAAYRAAVS